MLTLQTQRLQIPVINIFNNKFSRFLMIGFRRASKSILPRAIRRPNVHTDRCPSRQKDRDQLLQKKGPKMGGYRA